MQISSTKHWHTEFSTLKRIRPFNVGFISWMQGFLIYETYQNTWGWVSVIQPLIQWGKPLTWSFQLIQKKRLTKSSTFMMKRQLPQCNKTISKNPTMNNTLNDKRLKALSFFKYRNKTRIMIFTTSIQPSTGRSSQGKWNKNHPNWKGRNKE